jgi:hypothetical protein
MSIPNSKGFLDFRRMGTKQQSRRAPSADSVEKVFFGWWTKFSSAAGAFCARRCEGPHRFTPKRPSTLVSPLQSVAALEAAKNLLSRDFRVVRFSTFTTVSDISRRQPKPSSIA